MTFKETRGTGRTTRLWSECVEFAKAHPDKHVIWIAPFVPTTTDKPNNVRWIKRAAYTWVHGRDHQTIGYEPECVFKDHTV